MTETETKPATKTPRQPIVMQMATVAKGNVLDSAGKPCAVDAWKDMTGEDFGWDTKFNSYTFPETFKDPVAARQRLRDALESGSIESGTFRVAACGESFTPTVEQQQTNKVTM